MARIAIVGSYGVGLTVELDRMPEAGETVIGRTFRRDHGGKGSNQAVGCARLGADVDFLTAVGDDAFGQDALTLWREEDVQAEAVVVNAATMTAPIFVEPSGENRIVIVPGALALLGRAHVDLFAARSPPPTSASSNWRSRRTRRSTHSRSRAQQAYARSSTRRPRRHGRSRRTSTT